MGKCLLWVVLAIPLIVRGEDPGEKAYQILQQNCFACHGSALQMSTLDLRNRESILKGGERGAAVVPNYPEESKLYLFASHQVKPSMPPGKKLSDDELEVLRRWILGGALLPARDPEEKNRRAQLAALEERPITKEERQLWAFQQPRRHPLPLNENGDEARNPIDAFLLAKMEWKGLKPSPPAARRTLIRRAYLDLLGLPPSPEEVEAFVDDTSQGAYERLVDRLLASPHYGERWARHWMDLVRYADSGGFEFDRDRPNAWRYRDYLVRSFNDDKPFDRFTLEQLAGDEIAPDSQEAMIATGYLRLQPENTIKTERTRMDELDDIISTTSLTFLGVTLGCARCHNHKFDPVPQKDYYRIQSIFFSTHPYEHPLVSPEVVERHKAEQKGIDDLQAPLKEAKKILEEPYRNRLWEQEVGKLPKYMQLAWRKPTGERTESQRLIARQIENARKEEVTEEKIVAILAKEDKARHNEIKGKIEELEKQRPEPFAVAMAIGEDGREALPSYFLHRGVPDAKGSLMMPGVLSVAAHGEVQFPAAPEEAKSSWRRRGFAEWIASAENPLTARVMVNRLWQHHFGEGIVRTPSNFGRTGERPSHPELLDWLAVEFVDRGWSLQAMHRLMMTSNAYRMGSRDIPENMKRDPENRFFWRMPRQRLEAEILRDSMLAVAGTLDRKVGGPGVFPYIDPALVQASSRRNWPGLPDDDPTTWRRGIYVHSKRSIRFPLFEAFDQPDMIASTDLRNRSTTAPQALLLMNNASILLQAKYFAQRVEKEAGPDPAARVERAFRLALARPPTEGERASSVEFLGSHPEALVDFCQTLFNLNEFVYRP